MANLHIYLTRISKFSDYHTLQLLLTISASIVSRERSFSKMIMKYLHGTMSQEKLTNLAELSMEGKSLLKCDMDEVIIDDFVKKTA